MCLKRNRASSIANVVCLINTLNSNSQCMWHMAPCFPIKCYTNSFGMQWITAADHNKWDIGEIFQQTRIQIIECCILPLARIPTDPSGKSSILNLSLSRKQTHILLHYDIFCNSGINILCIITVCVHNKNTNVAIPYLSLAHHLHLDLPPFLLSCLLSPPEVTNGLICHFTSLTTKPLLTKMFR